MVIHVKDTEPPRVVSCPHSFVDHLERGQKIKRITWEEPVFKDNVAIQHVMASYLPGHYFSEGRHHVLYQAADGDGNRARCGFTITLKQREISHYHKTPKPSSRKFYNPQQHLPPPIAVPSPRHLQIPQQCHDVPTVPNGRMACIDRKDSKKCTPVCERGHVFYQKFSYRPPTYLCSSRRIDWKINRFIPDCSPVKKTLTAGMCPEGWEARDNTCIACPPGMYRNTASLCQLCSQGTFSDQFGAKDCQQCSPGEYTNSLGSRHQSDCKPGNYGKKNRGRIVQSVHRGGRTGLLHYNSWLNEEPYRCSTVGLKRNATGTVQLFK
ncbi:uncharacterized protein LOC111708775 [Eurytemora carolleeae]|uniref:uncharacterized protein LOC111708775 n=1 Tax=Eurytemora carolleeae TaxID=1294199 RepID=UPI000C7914A6|nr:uncharacterized protein LOC111708775 [Eurytemora carolleeae]|eukprot:XP_023338014.1 uncharacterized protein LOC111708775 [Eurytemora affinis]